MFKVGHRTLDLQDRSRRNWADTGPRPLLTEFWYPAVDEQNRDAFLGAGLEPFRYTKKGKSLQIAYHAAPEEAALLREWAGKAVDAAIHTMAKQRPRRKNKHRRD